MNAPVIMRPEVVPAEPVAPERAGSFWTAERVDALVRMHGDGLSASAMSREFGGAVTRHAVLGKLWRMGLSDPKPRDAAATLAHKRQRERAAYLARKAEAAPKPAPDLPVPAPTPEPDPLPPPQRTAVRCEGVSLLQLGPDDCRWPLGPAMARAEWFCGQEQQRRFAGLPYCLTHAEAARGVQPPRMRVGGGR